MSRPRRWRSTSADMGRVRRPGARRCRSCWRGDAPGRDGRFWERRPADPSRGTARRPAGRSGSPSDSSGSRAVPPGTARASRAAARPLRRSAPDGGRCGRAAAGGAARRRRPARAHRLCAQHARIVANGDPLQGAEAIGRPQRRRRLVADVCRSVPLQSPAGCHTARGQRRG